MRDVHVGGRIAEVLASLRRRHGINNDPRGGIERRYALLVEGQNHTLAHSGQVRIECRARRWVPVKRAVAVPQAEATKHVTHGSIQLKPLAHEEQSVTDDNAGRESNESEDDFIPSLTVAHSLKLLRSDHNMVVVRAAGRYAGDAPVEGYRVACELADRRRRDTEIHDVRRVAPNVNQRAVDGHRVRRAHSTNGHNDLHGAVHGRDAMQIARQDAHIGAHDGKAGLGINVTGRRAGVDGLSGCGVEHQNVVRIGGEHKVERRR